MIIPDANLLIYAHDERSVFHIKARAWWKATLEGDTPVGIPWVVVLAFTRIMTHPQICENPLTGKQAGELILQWLSQPQVRLLQVSEAAIGRFFDLLEQAGSGGNLSTDALIALHAMEQSATVYSNDLDFDRFPGIRWINPLKP
jgi:toxin-antitoxin system PIN domain toxin